MTNQKTKYTEINLDISTNGNDVETQASPDDNIIPTNSTNTVSNISSFLSKQTGITLMAWISLFLSILGFSFIGPMYKYLVEGGVPVILGVSWRAQCMLVPLFPMVLWERRKNQQSATLQEYSLLSRYPDLPYPLYVHILIAGLSWVGNITLYVYTLGFITTVLTSICWSIQPVFMAIYLVWTGKVIHQMEWFGVVLSIVGVTVACSNGLIVKSDIPLSHEIIGVTIAFTSAIYDCLIVIERQRTKKYVPLMEYTLLTSGIVAVVATLLSIMIEGTGVFCLDETCILGWLSHKWFVKLVLFGMVLSAVCNIGINYALQHISPLIFTAAGLIDPIVTGFFAWLLGVENIPQLQIWIGGFVVIAGLAVLTYGEKAREADQNDKIKEYTPKSAESTEGEVELLNK